MNSIKDQSLHDAHHVDLGTLTLTDEDAHSAQTRQVPPNTKVGSGLLTPPLLNKSLNLSQGDITVAAHEPGVINTQGYPTLPPIVTPTVPQP